MGYSGSGPDYEESIIACLRRGGRWEDAAGYLPPGRAALGWAQKQVKFQRAYEQGREARMRRHAMAEARREVEALMSGEHYEYRPFKEHWTDSVEPIDCLVISR